MTTQSDLIPDCSGIAEGIRANSRPDREVVAPHGPRGRLGGPRLPRGRALDDLGEAASQSLVGLIVAEVSKRRPRRRASAMGWWVSKDAGNIGPMAAGLL